MTISYYEKVGSDVICIDAEIPFEIPDTWEWMRLESCCIKEIRRGKSPKYVGESGTLVFAQKCNTKYSDIDVGLALFLDESILGRYPDDEYMQDGDVVINSTGTGTLGRVGIYHTTDNHRGLPIVPDSHVTVIRAAHGIQSIYVYAFMKANQSELEKEGEGSTNQKELKPLTLKEMLFADSEIDKCTVKKGDLLVCEGGDIGRSAIWMFEENIRIQNHIHRLRPYISLSNRFYYYVMYMWKQLGLIGGQGIGLQGFSSKMLHNLIVPLPSIDEQERIVAFIDKLFEQIESIEKSFS